MPEDFSNTQTIASYSLKEALAETVATGEVRCPGCGAQYSGKVLDPKGHDHVCICPGCRPTMLEKPFLPSGYSLVRELGRGGMGAVYLTKFQEEPRAIKLLLPQVALSIERRTLFLQEAQIQRQLKHPRIVELHSLEQPIPGVFCMVMEYVPGIHAGSLLENGPLSPSLAVPMILQASEALDFVHEKGFVHRDVKDPNLLVVSYPEAPQIKLADFGLAIPYALLGRNATELEAGAVQGAISGTLPYMPPEAFSAKNPVTPQFDLYALGATLYRLLSGEYPHDFSQGSSRTATVALKAPVPLLERNPSVPRALADLVMRSLARDPSERFQSAKEMSEALRALS